VLLSELIMPAPPGSEDQVMARAEEMARTIRSEEAFAAAARQWSATPTAGRGGRLDWTPLADLPPSLQPVIQALSPGQITQPLSVPGAVVLFYLRDSRGRLRPGATEQTVDYLTMALPSPAEGARILAVADSCDQVHVQANRYAPDPVSRRTSPLGAVPTDIAQRLSTLDPDEGSVIDYGAGATLVMLCSRTPTLIAGDADAASGEETSEVAETGNPSFPPLTPRDQMREQIYNRKINEAADAYLAELRADALVRQP
jgi:peptidyl-prolyl cis-trans isomerase SurA